MAKTADWKLATDIGLSLPFIGNLLPIEGADLRPLRLKSRGRSPQMLRDL